MSKIMERLEFHISYACLNNCIFCSERCQLERFPGKFVSKTDIQKKLRQFSLKGFNHISFTGGEPTLHPDFIEIAEFAKGLGYRTYVSSNGGLLSSRRFSRNALPYIDEISFSIHGHNSRIHNLHTGNAKSFSNLLSAIENIEESSKDTFGLINIVITRYNFIYLNKIIDFVSYYKRVKHVLISNFAPEGSGSDNFRELVIPLSRIKEKIAEAVCLAQSKSIALRFFGLPMCILGNHQDFSNDAWWSPRATIEKWKTKNKIFLKTTFSYNPTRNRVKTHKCRQCARNNICGGIFERYYREFGDSELSPLK